MLCVEPPHEDRHLERERHPRPPGAPAHWLGARPRRRVPAGNQGHPRPGARSSCASSRLLELLAWPQGLLGRGLLVAKELVRLAAATRIRRSTSSSADRDDRFGGGRYELASTCRTAARTRREDALPRRAGRLRRRGARAPDTRLIFCGDLNVARADATCTQERKPTRSAQRPDERALLEQLLAQRPRRHRPPLDPDNDDLFTWWAPWRNLQERNIGWRIDYVAGLESARRARDARRCSERSARAITGR